MDWPRVDVWYGSVYGGGRGSDERASFPLRDIVVMVVLILSEISKSRGFTRLDDSKV